MWSPHLLTAAAIEAGWPLEQRLELEARNKQFSTNGVQPILSLRHLAGLTGVSYWQLRRLVGRREEGPPYRQFFVAKRTGGWRRIWVPDAALMHLQRFIGKEILARVEPGVGSFAFHPGSSIVECARQHLGARWLVKLDIKNFFESLSEQQAFGVFSGLGYSPLVSFELSRLTTYPFDERHRRYLRGYPRGRYWSRRRRRGLLDFEVEGIRAYEDERLGHLPQGAPSSPMLSNLICRDVDQSLLEVATASDYVYTRYADDICFSMAAGSRAEARKVIGRTRAILRKAGLRLNMAKTAVIPPGARKLVLGLLVDGDDVRLTRSFKRSLECHLYYIGKYGLLEHSVRRGFDSPLSLGEHLRGRLAYAAEVEESWARGHIDVLKSALDDFKRQ